MAYSLIGKDFTPPDVRAKVTGKAKYAEDFRADGMAFCKLLLSPMPHAKVTNIDTSAIDNMPGVYGVLTADEVPKQEFPTDPILSNEVHYVGEPILAVAAVDESTAADALEKIKVNYEPLPFTVDPLESLYPGGINASTIGNMPSSAGGEGQGSVGRMRDVKWTAKDFAAVQEGQLPTGEALVDWSYGDLDSAFADAALVLDETFVTASNSHHSMEPRSSFAYWENGKCILHGSTQSQSFVMIGLPALLGVGPDQFSYISEFCGGGFGSKGTAYPVMVVPAHMSKKIGRPCLLRISRAEEYYLGSARAGFQGRAKLGFNAEGRLTAADVYIVQQNGSKAGFWDYTSAGEAVSLVYNPEAMRYRAIPINTNTPPCGPQRGPGQNQIACAFEPLLDKAAKQLGIDRLAIREINAPDHNAKVGENQQKVSSSYMREALQMASGSFNWEEKKNLSGRRNGSKVIGIGVGQAYHSAGAAGFDGLVRITPDGKLHIHSGVGNLGTYSYAGTSRVAAEVLGYNWDNVIIERGDSRKHLPWNLGQFGSNTSFTMSRSNYAAAVDAKNKLLEIAAMDLGGSAEDYELKDETVVARGDAGKSITFAQAAQRAIELGGKFSGQESADDLFFLTKTAVQGVAGSGLVGAAKDNLPMNNHIPALTASFMQIELDLETGKYEIQDYVLGADCGTVVHPKSLHTQLRGGSVMGVGLAALERVVYDPQNGLPANVGFYQAKPPSYLDLPSEMKVMAVDQPDPDIPMGMKGVGEPPMGSAAGALLSAISDALGGHYFNRTPVLPDMIVNAASGRPQSHKPLQVNTQ